MSRIGRRPRARLGLAIACVASVAAFACAPRPSAQVLYPSGTEAAAGILNLALARQISLPDNWVLLPDEYAGVAVDPLNGTVYIGGRDGSFLALDPVLGEVQWELELPGAVGGIPTVHERTLLLGTDDGALVSIDLDAHEINWVYETDGVIRNPALVEGGVVYFDNSRDQVFALDLRDGGWRWQYEREVPKDFSIQGRAGLAYLPADDPEASETGVLFTAFDDGRVVAIGASSGEALWIANLAPRDAAVSGVFADVDSTPLIDVERGELVVVGASAGVHGLGLADGAVRWREPFKGGGTAVMAPDGSYLVASPLAGLISVRPGGGVNWRKDLDPGAYSTPLVVGQTLYLSNADFGLHAFDALRGTHLAALDTGSGMSAQPVYDPTTKRLYAMTNRGVLYGFDVTPAGGAN